MCDMAWFIHSLSNPQLRIYSVFSLLLSRCTLHMADEREIFVQFGRRLRILRETRGLTQERLAELSRLDRTYIGDAELGKRNPTLRSIEKLADALEVDFLAMLSDSVLSDTLENFTSSGD